MSEPEAIGGALRDRSLLRAYRGQTVLISGGRGYIGSLLTQALSHAECRLILVDRSPADVWMPRHHDAEVSIVRGDVSERETWDVLLRGVDRVFHLAGLEYTQRADHDPVRDLYSNALPVLHLVEACRERRLRPGIIFVSSANIFGAVKTLPVNEEHADAPLVPWSLHKLLGEKYLSVYAQRLGITSTILRLPNVYGPTARPSVATRVVINRVIAEALAGAPLMLYGNRDCLRDYMFIEDVVDALLVAGAHVDNGRTYVVGSEEGVRIADVWNVIAQSIRAHTGAAVPICLDPAVELDAFELREFVADAERFRRATGWGPRVRLAEGIDATVRYLLKARADRTTVSA